MRELDGPMPPEAQDHQPGGTEGDVLTTSQPPSPWQPTERPSRLRFVKPIIGLLFVGLPVIGFAVRTVREVKATPNDNAACESVMTLITSDPNSEDPAPFLAMLDAVGRADDAAIADHGAKLNQAMFAEDFATADQALTSISDRCQDISSDFDDRLQQFCREQASMCRDRGFSLF